MFVESFSAATRQLATMLFNRMGIPSMSGYRSFAKGVANDDAPAYPISSMEMNSSERDGSAGSACLLLTGEVRGRRRLANVDRAMAYRFLHSPVPQNLAPGEWWPWYRNRLSKDIQAVCKEVSGAHTMEQLEAMHVWKMTSHSTLYL